MNDAERPDPTELKQLRRGAWRMFDAGDFAGAAADFNRLCDLGVIGELELQALVEILVDRGEPGRAIEALRREIKRRQGDGASIVPLATSLFDLQVEFGTDPEARHEAALQVLEALAAAVDADIWMTTLSERRLTEIERSFRTPVEMLEALEQKAFAPNVTGLPDRARAKIEEIGHLHVGDPETARAVERLLHALGDPEAAYRIERARRSTLQRATAPSRTVSVQTAVDLTGLSVVIAGGHAALRSMIERDLTKAGVARVRGIPSATEANRAGREVQSVITGGDVVVLLVRQLAHSTSDQVRRAAARAGVPVVTADSAGISGVRRAIERFVIEGSTS
jgi:hypothetical protein